MEWQKNTNSVYLRFIFFKTMTFIFKVVVALLGLKTWTLSFFSLSSAESLHNMILFWKKIGCKGANFNILKLVNFFSLKVCLKVWISPIKANERTILQCAPIFCVLNKLLNLKSLKCWGVTFWKKIESTKTFEKIKKRNAPGEARTHGLQIMRLTRCLLRYRGYWIVCLFLSILNKILI